MRAFALFLCACGVAVCVAQQEPQYTNWVMNLFNVDPAVAGSHECLDVRLGYREQWVGFPGAPSTGWLSLNAPIRTEATRTSGHYHGVGLTVEGDDTGPLSRTTAQLAYAYHIKITNEQYMSFGLFAGVQQFKLSVDETIVVDNNDPVLGTSGRALVAPVVVPGFWWYNKKAWFGAALHGALANRLGDIGTDARLARQAMVHGGYRLRFAHRTSITPAALLKLSTAPPALDLNAMIEWRRLLGIGLGYRNGDAFLAMVKVSFLEYFTLGYAYDLNTSRLSNANSNTHEVVLAISACPADDGRPAMIQCPAFE
jgi:type IX secretion system PorP/SprF family membrane protein